MRGVQGHLNIERLKHLICQYWFQQFHAVYFRVTTAVSMMRWGRKFFPWSTGGRMEEWARYTVEKKNITVLLFFLGRGEVLSNLAWLWMLFLYFNKYFDGLTFFDQLDITFLSQLMVLKNKVRSDCCSLFYYLLKFMVLQRNLNAILNII